MWPSLAVKQCYSDGVGTLASETEIMTAGNVVFGGLIGLGVDAASGAIVSTWGRNHHEPHPELRRSEEGPRRAHGKHASASARAARIAPKPAAKL